ncbi:HDIG domain-containing metalloprotein [Parasphaerochaeta coccoides]|uniref:Metal dependent phosphohydrolase n=1 Tax=Parasphaerochaeta coccoides (strain ATCC BAA-1237 / DSM 17374 / SPN1) TaxID=760011 RepID=F4GJH9_PARC1|nr:HDIG domain-containing metalloprotein [Parasphaerochaeta coccoides]AEC02244.1 metal dependent phosphohydrolase [Parasphaerochaeta coccoides DSM 17374]
MFTRDQALVLWKKYNASESLFHHALTVEAIMRSFAMEHGDDPEYWGLVGLLHDIDWEMFPEIHCKKAPDILKEIGADDAFIHAVVSHGWNIVTDVKPEHYMEKVLYTIDELSGLIVATALMRPEKLNGMSVKSVRKKWKTPSFAAGVNRDIITSGAELLGEDIDSIIARCITALQPKAEELGLGA